MGFASQSAIVTSTSSLRASFIAGNEHNGNVKRPMFEHIIGLFVLPT